MFEFKIDIKEVHVHHHVDTTGILRKLDAVSEQVEKLVDSATSLNHAERKRLQGLVKDLEALGKPD